MMSGSNPRPEFMAKLKSLCKNLEGEVKHLDGEVKAALLKDKSRSNLAAERLHDDVLQLKSEMARTLGKVREQNTNLASFVAEMTEEVEGMVRRTDKMEEFMVQYGYKPTAKVELSQILSGNNEQNNQVSQDNIAPPAAAEFMESGEEREEPGASRLVAEESVKTRMDASPSIFDIGLSKYGLEEVLGKKKLTEDRPKQKEPKAVSPGKYYFPIDEDPDSSPALRLRSRPLSGLQDMSGVDLSPGLARRGEGQEMAAQNTPELPVIQSDASYQVLAGVQARSPEERVSKVKKEHMMMMSSGTPGTPEMPELETLSLRQFLGQARTEGSPDTPDLPPFNLYKHINQ